MNEENRLWKDPIEIGIIYRDSNNIEDYLWLCKPEDRSLALAISRYRG